MRSRTLQRLVWLWAIISVLWIIAVAWETFENLPAAAMAAPAIPAVSHELSRLQVIKVGAAFAVVPPALIFIVGVRLFRVFKGFR
jgi:hypothetical protein